MPTNFPASPTNVAPGTWGVTRSMTPVCEIRRALRAVMQAGFDGYLNDDPRRNQGFAVVLGAQHTNTPVQQIPKPGFAEVAAESTDL